MRCFLAFELPNELKEKLNGLKSNFNFKGIKLVETENLHITVKFLGDIDDKTLEKVINSDLSINKVFSEIKGIGTFPNSEYVKVIWVGSTNLQKTMSNIDNKLFNLGFKKEKTYEPHITIGRVKYLENDLKENLREIINKNSYVDFGKIEINSISLMKSILTPNGPKYEVIKKW
ncbi:2'-5' RNA ligase [Methanococcus vannielii SB]|uniref:RNA 2',3'-cyclic phosphodiesterase n=1 Tax=Methanococcus vannielii (strain ATCC 35089 / DSM 1224 / JCM 13029 / OCM 148 / SB) TaxID=406327 RepID=A6USA6_METVS|nr:RNA 2',3'-cyclic phosphodiesterase [Methanococcus vannielii]ABR55378.1 2'-5' RNA ligase [Methanococcus vannielii SB]